MVVTTRKNPFKREHRVRKKALGLNRRIWKQSIPQGKNQVLLVLEILQNWRITLLQIYSTYKSVLDMGLSGLCYQTPDNMALENDLTQRLFVHSKSLSFYQNYILYKILDIFFYYHIYSKNLTLKNKHNETRNNIQSL